MNVRRRAAMSPPGQRPLRHPQLAVNSAKADEVVKVAQGHYVPWNENEGDAARCRSDELTCGRR